MDDPLGPAQILRAAHEVALSRVDGPLVLAVSGGRDSMALLFATARWARERIAAVAVFDHATGQHATDAASLVAAEGRRLGLTVIRERARHAGTTEAAWRDARWEFLRRVAASYRSRIATGHSRDDQLETVFMRALRGAGARGLAALAAPSPVVRPWLAVSREEIARWADTESVPFVEDPSNATARFLRGRVRHDLLPAFEQAAPGFAEELLGLADRAASWRRDVELLIDGMHPQRAASGALRVPVGPLVATTNDGRAVLWQALFARLGIALDARGTRELVRFTSSERRGAMVTLAKGAVALRVADEAGDTFELRRPLGIERRTIDWSGHGSALPVRLGSWRFKRLVSGVAEQSTNVWEVGLPADSPVQVRRWQAGDRIRTRDARTGRRVTRYFAEAKVPALDRGGWPVVLVDGEVVWVPGVCRSIAVPHRPGRPDLIWYRCEREHYESW
ncbi:MAG TPA: tRNA lysidine(34) synthetase TilS [Gemmatimonas sp.]|nr:tRNA lysidine(34) synthetase TilS [Gemmatimonas sp.]